MIMLGLRGLLLVLAYIWLLPFTMALVVGFIIGFAVGGAWRRESP